MNPKPGMTKLRMAVIDRAGLAGELEQIARENGFPVDVLPCASVLEVVGEPGVGQVAGLVVSVAAAGPFLIDVLRWSESRMAHRVPTMLLGSGRTEDEAAARLALGREHVRWREAPVLRTDLAEWLVMAFEVHAIRSHRSEHDAMAQALREARMQLFHGFITSYTPPEGAPCGPPLPTSIEEIQPLREARSQFERAHIQAVVREWGSLKDASSALGISYTSLWRRLR